MKKFRLLVLPLILIAGALLYFLVPWEAGRQSVDFNDASETVRQARREAGRVKNYKYSTDIQAGEQIKISVLNRVEVAGEKRQMVDFSWNIPQMSGMAAMYTDGKVLYLYHPLKNKWLLPSEEPTISPFVDYFWKQLDLVDPVANILKVEHSSKVSVYSGAVQKESDTVAIQVIPQGAALGEIKKALPPQLAGADLKDVKQFFWISKQDLLVKRYEVQAKVSFFGLKTMDFRTVSKVSNYNETEIKIPKPLVDKIRLGK